MRCKWLEIDGRLISFWYYCVLGMPRRSMTGIQNSMYVRVHPGADTTNEPCWNHLTSKGVLGARSIGGPNDLAHASGITKTQPGKMQTTRSHLALVHLHLTEADWMLVPGTEKLLGGSRGSYRGWGGVLLAFAKPHTLISIGHTPWYPQQARLMRKHHLLSLARR